MSPRDGKRLTRPPAACVSSLDTKAAVVLGEFSCRGRARGMEAVQALDHDLAIKKKRVPVGILEEPSGRLDLSFGLSHKTSDLLVDCLEEWWWWRHCLELSHLEAIVLHVDNGPESSGRRTQLLARLAGFADASGLRIRLVYYPPYHSKYHPIERCWMAACASRIGARATTASTTRLNAAGACWKSTGTARCSTMKTLL